MRGRLNRRYLVATKAQIGDIDHGHRGVAMSGVREQKERGTVLPIEVPSIDGMSTLAHGCKQGATPGCAWCLPCRSGVYDISSVICHGVQRVAIDPLEAGKCARSIDAERIVARPVPCSA